MSCHKHNFHCFNAVGGASDLLEHHTTRLPKISQHGIVAYPVLEPQCYLCSVCQHAQTTQDVETQLLPFYHSHSQHHHHPNQFVLSGPSRRDETHSANECHIHHQRYDKKIVLVKNSDPSFRKTIILHRRGLRSFGLFLEEVSELMQHHIRKLYTPEGAKIDSIQSLLQSPGVLVCVGQELFYPLVMENFEKMSSCKLPKLSGTSSVIEHSDGNERHTTKTSIIPPNLEYNKTATKHSVSSEKSVPDGRDSPDVGNSRRPCGATLRDDDIEKQVFVNKDGSLSMEMKVRFRLSNDETLHWSTNVKKTANLTNDYVKTQTDDLNCSESELMSGDEAYFTQHYQEYNEKPHCPHCQGSATWKNIPGKHGASKRCHTSSSSASSHTVVSRKTVIERQKMSRSSEELADQVVETCITQSIDAAEIVEIWTIQNEACSPKHNVKSLAVGNSESTGLNICQKNLDLKTSQKIVQEEEGDNEKEDDNNGSFPQINNDRQKEAESEVMDMGLLIQHLASKDKKSKRSRKHTKPKTSKSSYICRCGEPKGFQIEPKGKNEAKAKADVLMQTETSTNMCVTSNASSGSIKSEEIQKVIYIEKGGRSKSVMSVNSDDSNRNSTHLNVATKGPPAGDDKETKDRTSNIKPCTFSDCVKASPVQYNSEEDLEKQAEEDSELRTQSSLSALSSVSAELKNIPQEASEDEDKQVPAEGYMDSEARIRTALSDSNGSIGSNTSEDKTRENLVGNEADWGLRPSLKSASSVESSGIPTSVRTTSAFSTKSSISTKSKDSKTLRSTTSAKSSMSTEHEELYENTANNGEMLERPLSKLTASNISTIAKYSNVAASRLDVVYTEERVIEDDSERKSVSPQSAYSIVSTISNMSKHTANAEEDSSLANTEQKHKYGEERPPSSMSDKYVQSCLSGASFKSAEKKPSSLSKKSVKSSHNEVCWEKCPDENNTFEEPQTREESMVSTKTETSLNSAKSDESKPQGSRVDKIKVDEERHVERSPSNLSVRSEKSTKSSVSKDGKRLKVYKESLENGFVNPEENGAKNGSEGKPLSRQSVRSNTSVKSKFSNCCNDSTETKSLDNINSVNENKKANIERAPSSTSTSSVQSSVSEFSIKSDNRTASALSKKSNASVKSEQTNKVSSGCSALDKVDTDEKVRTPNGTTNLSTSNISSKSPTPYCEKNTERSSSNLSVKSDRLCNSNVPKRSEVYEHYLKNDADNCDVRIIEGDNEGSTISVVSAHSVKSQCERFEDEEINLETPQHRTPAKSVLSHIYEKSVNSADRPQSALSAKSAKSNTSKKSVQSNISHEKCEFFLEIYNKGTACQARVNSALSSKMTNSTTSTYSSKVKEQELLPEDHCGEHEDRTPSSMSTISVRSTKSNISKISQDSKTSSVICKSKAKSGNNENSEEEENERTSGSSMSIHSVKSDISARSGLSKCSTDIPVREINTRTDSPASVISINSNSSKVLSDVNPKGGRTDTKASQDRSDSAISAKSPFSAKSNNTKFSSAPSVGCVCDLGQVQRPKSNLSIKSTTSCLSSNSVTELAGQPTTTMSSKTEISRFTSTVFQISVGINEECNIEGSSDSFSANAKSSSTVTQCEVTNVDNTPYEEEKTQRPPSTLSAKSAKSTKSSSSTKSCKNQISNKPVDEINVKNVKHKKSNFAGFRDVEERTISPVSLKSDISEALSNFEVPFVTIEKSEGRSPTVMSSKSKASGHSKKSRTSEIQGAKRSRKSQSSLSVHSHVSVFSKKNNVTNVSTPSVLSEKRGKEVSKEVKEGSTDEKSSKTNRSTGQCQEDECIYLNKHLVFCHVGSAERELSQTLSCIDKNICEATSPAEFKSEVSNGILNCSLENVENNSVKSDKGSKHTKKNMDAGDFKLIPSILPNASPTDVVNEWLKHLPTDTDLYEMEELENNSGVKDSTVADETNGIEHAYKNESKAENAKEVSSMDMENTDCKTTTEAINKDNTSTQEDSSKMFKSSVQVMKVLLNPKLDRCNSLPEISPVLGRKLSTSAQCLLDCLVKLQLIDHDPKNANEKNERYQELMSILQSLWLSSPLEKENEQNTNDHSVEREYNHTSSSGVDVNSGSTGSGKSSDGVKSSNNENTDESNPQNSLIIIDKAYNETSAQWKTELEEVNQEEEDQATVETIRTNDSLREASETQSSSNKSSGESSSNDEKLSKKQSQNPDPVWLLTLLNKIEKQFMTHYISAMNELKIRWSLSDTDQLYIMIDELKSEVHRKIQISIEKEVRKIQSSARLPRPPDEPISRTSAKQTEQRRRGLKIKLQQSIDSQTEKSDSTTTTSYSDQRGENIDEYCPCETCVEKKLNSTLPISALKAAPCVMDFDQKRILMMKTTANCAEACGNNNDKTAAETIVEKVIVRATQQVESNKLQKSRDEVIEYLTDLEEEGNTCLNDQITIEETIKVFDKHNEEEIVKAGAEIPGSKCEATCTAVEKTLEVETASEEETDDSVIPDGKSGFNVNIKMAEKDIDILQGMREDDSEEETTETMSSATTREFPNHANKVQDDTVALAYTKVQTKEESEQEKRDILVKEALSSNLGAGHEEGRYDWLKLKRKLLPSMRIILLGKDDKQSVINVKNNETVKVHKIIKDQAEEEIENGVLQETKVLSENCSSEEIEYCEIKNKELIAEVSEAHKTDFESKEEEEMPEMNEDGFSETRSNPTFLEDKKEAIETSSSASSKHGSETDNIDDQSPLETDMKDAREGTVTTSDSGAESDRTSDEDETEDEKETTINQLSIIQEEESTDGEISVTSEADLKKNLITSARYKDARGTDEEESEVQASEREEVEEESTVDQEETSYPVNSNDYPNENEAPSSESPGEPNECVSKANKINLNKMATVREEQETVMAANPDQESDFENGKEAGHFSVQEEMLAAEVFDGCSTKREGENEESDTATTEHKSEKDEEKIPSVSADDSADENIDSLTEDESAEEHNKGTTAKVEEVGTFDNEDAFIVSESDSAEDTNSTLNYDENAKVNGAISSKPSIEYAENDTKDEQAVEDTTETPTSVNAFEEENEESVGPTSETEDDPTDADITENESGQDAMEEATSAQGSESEGEANEDKGDKLNEEQSLKVTDSEVENTVKSGSVEDKATNDDTSAAEEQHEINNAYNVSKITDPGETTDDKESDVFGETEPEHTSSNVVGENESEEEGSTSANDKNSADSFRVGSDKTSGEEDTSHKDYDSMDMDSEPMSEKEIVDVTSQECTDKIESLLPKERKPLANVEEIIEGVQDIIKPTEGETANADKLESRCDNCSEALSKGFYKEYKITDKDLSETEMVSSEITSEGKCVGNKAGHENSADKAEDGSVADKEPQLSENNVTATEDLFNNVKDSEQEDEDTDTHNEGWSGSLGDSADGEDEAEEDSEHDEDTDDIKKTFAVDKLGNLDATKKAVKKTLLVPLDILIKDRADSEDGAYADIDESETEIHVQDDVTNLDSKS